MGRWIARRLWFAILWAVRRPSSRRFQRQLVALVPERFRATFVRRMMAQERFARRIGLKVLTFVVNLFLLSVSAGLLLSFFLNATAEGWFVIPTREALERSPAPNGSPSWPAR